MYKNIYKTLANSIKIELKPFNSHRKNTIWEVYFCTLENLNRKFGYIDKYVLRSSLLVEIIKKKTILSHEDQHKIVELWRKNNIEAQESNVDNMHYISNFDRNLMIPIV